MTSLPGLDSAIGPTVAQARQALGQGVKWWGWYVGGPGAYHVWSDAEVSVLQAVGFTQSLPIWVPRLDLTGSPAADYATARARARRLGWLGAIALDTEASMRGLATLVPYVNGWNAAAAAAGDPEVVYGGGNYVGSAHPWWINPGIPTPGQCLQTGLGIITGEDTDSDLADAGFPLAFTQGAAPTGVQPQLSPPWSLEPIVGYWTAIGSGTVCIADDGSVYTFNAPFHGSASGAPYFVGRHAAQVRVAAYPQCPYTIKTTSAEFYDFGYDFGQAPARW